MQPNFENNIYMYCYFIDFIIIGLFLPLSMLIGAIVANFQKHKIKISINILCQSMPKAGGGGEADVLLQIIGFRFSLIAFFIWYLPLKNYVPAD